MANNLHKQWRKRLRAAFTHVFDSELIESWGFFEFLREEVPQCETELDVAKRIYADMVDSEGAVDHLRGIYSCVMYFLGRTVTAMPDDDAQFELGLLSVGEIDHHAIFKWFDKYVAGVTAVQLAPRHHDK